MTLIKSNVAWAQYAKQTGKGVAQSTFDLRARLASDDQLRPRAETAVFAETDGSRDAPNSEKMQGGAEGALARGVRDALFHRDAEAALGSKATTGTTNYIHTVSGANTLAYWTIQQNLGDTLWEQFTDAVAQEWTVSGEAGGFLTSSLSWLARTPTRLTTAPTGPAEDGGALYTFNDATVSIGGSAVGNVRSFNMTLTNGLQLLQTDDIVPYDISVGTREVVCTFDMLFEDLVAYNSFHYGSSAGTTQSSTTFTTDLLFSFSKGANNSIDFDFDAVNYEEFPIGPDTGGDPIIVSVRARARRNANGLLRTIVKNQTAT